MGLCFFHRRQHLATHRFLCFPHTRTVDHAAGWGGGEGANCLDMPTQPLTE